MKKVFSLLAGLSAVTLGILSLASCSSSSFYKDWSNAGADIDESVPFEYISFDDVKSKLQAKDSFLVMYGTPSDSTDVSNVQGICYDAYVTNQEAKIYFVNCEDAVSSVSRRDEYTKELKVYNCLTPSYLNQDDSQEGLNGLVAVLYENGTVTFDTSRAFKYAFCENFSTFDSTRVDIHAVAAYSWEYYPVK